MSASALWVVEFEPSPPVACRAGSGLGQIATGAGLVMADAPGIGDGELFGIEERRRFPLEDLNTHGEPPVGSVPKL